MLTVFLIALATVAVLAVLVAARTASAKLNDQGDGLELSVEVSNDDLPGEDSKLSPSEFFQAAKEAKAENLAVLVPDSDLNVWVVPHKDTAGTKHKWAVKLEGNPEPISTHKTQMEAEKAGREKAKELNSEMILLGRNGEIRKKNSYGNDPKNVKG